MALKAIFNSMKREGYVVKDLDMFLLKMNDTDSDRAIDINAPSQAGTCLRSRYYARTQAPRDGMTIDARTRRIFDNGTKTHERLQEYLKDLGILLIDEVPLVNLVYNIQGHTDGFLDIGGKEIAILEIKSINSRGYSSLNSAKPEHRSQGLIYLYCAEERRKDLRAIYPTFEDFLQDKVNRYKYYASRYTHLKDGSKYTREEKIMYQQQLHEEMDALLYTTTKPINKVVYLYENKDTQELKEFVVTTKDADSAEELQKVLNEYDALNEYVANNVLPKREGKNKSDSTCRWCAFKNHCWVL